MGSIGLLAKPAGGRGSAGGFRDKVRIAGPDAGVEQEDRDHAEGHFLYRHLSDLGSDGGSPSERPDVYELTAR